MSKLKTGISTEMIGSGGGQIKDNEYLNGIYGVFMFQIHVTLQAMNCDVTMWRLLVTNVAVEKIIIITYSYCMFIALFIQHAMRMRRIILSSVALSGCSIFFIIP
jgi:hypothetical protein